MSNCSNLTDSYNIQYIKLCLHQCNNSFYNNIDSIESCYCNCMRRFYNNYTNDDDNDDNDNDNDNDKNSSMSIFMHNIVFLALFMIILSYSIYCIRCKSYKKNIYYIKSNPIQSIQTEQVDIPECIDTSTNIYISKQPPSYHSINIPLD